MEINSQICTTREQSERLLALGLKKETADMIHVDYGGRNYMIRPYDWLPASKVDMEKYIPAWSLHRLIKFAPIVVYSRPVLYLTMLGESVYYCTEDNDEDYEKSFSMHFNLYDNMIDCIEWLIKERCINKEYIAI